MTSMKDPPLPACASAGGRMTFSIDMSPERQAELWARHARRAPDPPRPGFLNLAQICHTLESSREQLIAAIEKPATAEAREAHGKAVRSIGAALACARGDDIRHWEGMAARAKAANVSRDYQKRANEARTGHRTRLQDLLAAAQKDIDEARRLAAEGERAAAAAAAAARASELGAAKAVEPAPTKKRRRKAA